MKTRILVTDPLHPTALEILRSEKSFEIVEPDGKLTPENLIKELSKGYDGLIVRSGTRATAEAISAAAPRLRVIGRAGVGVDNIDLEEATRRGVAVINTPDGNTVSAAEHTMALLLSMARNVPQSFASLKAGEWTRSAFTGVELRGKVLGVIGLGRIGQRVVKAAKGFSMKVAGYDPFVSKERCEALGIAYCETVEEVLAQSDFVTLHVPFTEKTKNIINRDSIKAMKDGARLINCARGGLVDEDALAEALQSGKLAGAAFDVFAKEPPPKDHPLLLLPNFVATPHLGAVTGDAQRAVGRQVAEKVTKFFIEDTYEDALNVPFRSVPENLKPMLEMAETLGAFHSQLCSKAIQKIQVEYFGPKADIKPITCAFLKALLSEVTDTGVNWVNAFYWARERGIEVEEGLSHEDRGYSNLLRTRVKNSEGGECEIWGTMLDGRLPRIVHINGYGMDLTPEKHMLVVENKDVPGVLGNIASTMGALGLNIGECRLGRKEKHGHALTLIGLDAEATDEALARLLEFDEVVSVKKVRL